MLHVIISQGKNVGVSEFKIKTLMSWNYQFVKDVGIESTM